MSKGYIMSTVKFSTATAAASISDLYDDGITTRDALIISLVTDGYSLNMATNGYAQFAKSTGLTSAVVSRKPEALDWLADECPDGFSSVDGVTVARDALVAEFGVAESTARDYIKAYCVQEAIVLPVQDSRALIFNWFKTTESITKEAFMEYATDELGRSKSNANEYWKGYELHLFLVA